MKIAISGSNGFIGKHIYNYFFSKGHTLIRIVRPGYNSIDRESVIIWDYKNKTIETEKFEGCDVVIHLAGENVAGKKWSKDQKSLIYNSRVEGTSLISEAISSVKYPPRVFLCASAVGYYGNRSSDEKITESSPPGKSFLSTVAQKWEEASGKAKDSGIRTINMRIGIVMGLGGGMLSRVLKIFKWGFGGKIGSGKNIMPWIALSEIPQIISYLIEKENIEGPVNIVSPNPVSNAEFTKILAKVVSRPAFMHLPEFFLKFLFGEMADELFFSGARVIPDKLLKTGYKFKYAKLEKILKNVLYNQ